MKVTILTLGTRGDVQPYVAIGKGLRKQGHEVTICTGGSFKEFVEKEGITFHKASIDFMEILKTTEGQAIFNGEGNVFKSIKYAKEVINPLYRRTFSDFLEASYEADIILYHPKSLVGVDIAQYLKIPCVNMAPVPMVYPITEFPCLAISAKRNLGASLNKISYKAVKMGESSSMGIINEFRISELNLPKRKTGSLTYEVDGKVIPIIHPISPSLFEEVKSWKDGVFLPGFYFVALEEDRLEPEIEEFLQTGHKPIVISFSSMPMKSPEIFKDKLLKALELTGDRAIVLTGISGLEFEGHKNILTVSKAPHRLIFPRAKGIIHHGGIGTLAEALLSGVPNVIMPFNVDQPFWAKQMYDKGFSIRPIEEKSLSVEELVTTFKMMSDKKVIDQSKAIGDKISAERGIEQTIAYLEQLVGERNA